MNQEVTDFAVLNADDPRTAALAGEVSQHQSGSAAWREVERGASSATAGLVMERRIRNSAPHIRDPARQPQS
jgi:hypothetical protein